MQLGKTAGKIMWEQQIEKSQRFLNGIAFVTQILQIALIKNDYAESQGITPRVQIQHICCLKGVKHLGKCVLASVPLCLFWVFFYSYISLKFWKEPFLRKQTSSQCLEKQQQNTVSLITLSKCTLGFQTLLKRQKTFFSANVNNLRMGEGVSQNESPNVPYHRIVRAHQD